MSPEEVLALMSEAHRRYQTVRAALRYRGHGPTLESLYARQDSSSVASDTRYREPDGTFGWRCRIWHQSAYRWRRELDLPCGGVELTGCYGTDFHGLPKMWDLRVSSEASGNDPWWLDSPKDHYWTFYLVDDISGLHGVVDDLDLRVEGEVEWAGRGAVRLVGTPPAGEWEMREDPDPLAWGADEYELLVDAEVGVVLRHANRLGGVDFEVLEMEEVYFDEDFAEEVLLPPRPLSCW